MSEEKNLLSEKLSNRNRSRFRSMKQKKVSLRNNERKFPSATIFRFFLKQAAILNDKKHELKLLITVVAAYWQPEEHF